MAKAKKKSGNKLVIAVVAVLVAVMGIGAAAVIMGGEPASKLPIVAEAKTYENPLTGQVSLDKLPARPLQVSIDNVGDAIP